MLTGCLGTPRLCGLVLTSLTESEATPLKIGRVSRAYEMLVESVHLGLSARDIGALRGISGERARQLMVYAAYTWAGREKIDLSGKSVPFKNEAKFVRGRSKKRSQFFGGLREKAI